MSDSAAVLSDTSEHEIRSVPEPATGIRPPVPSWLGCTKICRRRSIFVQPVHATRSQFRARAGDWREMKNFSESQLLSLLPPSEAAYRLLPLPAACDLCALCPPRSVSATRYNNGCRHARYCAPHAVGWSPVKSLAAALMRCLPEPGFHTHGNRAIVEGLAAAHACTRVV